MWLALSNQSGAMSTGRTWISDKSLRKNRWYQRTISYLSSNNLYYFYLFAAFQIHFTNPYNKLAQHFKNPVMSIHFITHCYSSLDLQFIYFPQCIFLLYKSSSADSPSAHAVKTKFWKQVRNVLLITILFSVWTKKW